MFVPPFSQNESWQNPKISQWVNGLSGWEWSVQEDSLATIEYFEETQKSNTNSKTIVLAAVAALSLLVTGLLTQNFSTLRANASSALLVDLQGSNR